MSASDQDWEHLSDSDPYWAVATDERFRQKNLDDGARQEFFQSGETYIDWALKTVRERLDAGYVPRRALDFGCGVGRLLLPLARCCDQVVGVDVAAGMLREAAVNLSAQGLTNVALVRGDDSLSQVSGTFDFINSYIVFQHIPYRRGLRLLRHLVRRLEGGGVAALHFGYSKSQFDKDLERVWMEAPAPWSALLHACLHKLKHWQLCPKPRPAAEIRMYSYNLSAVFHVLQKEGVHRSHVEFTDHGGEYGAVLFFQVPTTPGQS